MSSPPFVRAAPAGLAAVNPAKPQSWDEYSYVANQPLSATDPLGLHPLQYFSLALYCCTGPDPFLQWISPVFAGGPPAVFSAAYGGGDYWDGWGPPSPMFFRPTLTGRAAALADAAAARVSPAGGAGAPPLVWVPSGPDAWIGASGSNVAQAPMDPPIGMDIFHCPGCPQLWQNTYGATSDLWYGTLGEIAAPVAAEAGTLWAGLGSIGQAALAMSPAAYEAGLFSQDFLAGWNGSYAPTWANAAGAEIHRIVVCPPWEAVAGSCG